MLVFVTSNGPCGIASQSIGGSDASGAASSPPASGTAPASSKPASAAASIRGPASRVDLGARPHATVRRSSSSALRIAPDLDTRRSGSRQWFDRHRSVALRTALACEPMSKDEHHYRAHLIWDGNRGDGTSSYTAYGREYRVIISGKPDIQGTADVAFRGEA